MSRTLFRFVSPLAVLALIVLGMMWGAPGVAGQIFVGTPAPQSGSPMTYMIDGTQYLVVAISGGNYSGE